MSIDPRLAALGATAVGAHKPRIFISADGPPASGKSAFIRTMPGPIVVMNFDQGLEGVCDVDLDGNEIAKIDFEMPDLDTMGSKTASPEERAIAVNSYKRFKDLMHRSFPIARSIAVDTGGGAYALAQIARFGQIAQLGEVQPAMWTSMQAEYEQIFLEYTKHNCNLFVTHRQGSKFMGLKDEKDLKGYKQMQFLAQVHLRFEKRISRDAKGKAVDIELVRVVEKCRQRLALENPAHPDHEFPVVFMDEEKIQSVGGDFATIVQSVFPASKPTDWK